MADAYNMTSDMQSYSPISTSETRKNIKKYKSSHPNITKTELADYIYNVYAIEWGRSRIHPFKYIAELQRLFELNSIESNVGFVTDNTGARMTEIMEFDDLIPMVATESGHYYTFPTIFSYAGESRADIENQTFISLTESDVKLFPKKHNFTNAKKIVLPATSAEQNKSVYEFEVNMADVNSQNSTLKLTQEHFGHLKYPNQDHILNFYDVDKEQRTFYELQKKEMLEVVKSEKDKNEWRAQIEENHKAQKDSIKADLEDFHGSKIQEVLNYKILSQGVTRKDSTLKYEATYTIGGLIKKAGKNIIFNAGKLIGEQMKVDDEDRNRTSDAYMPFNRAFQFKISISIPDGYTLENPENFNVNIRNEYASFTSEPKIEKNKLVINIKKSYLKTLVPISEWKKILEMIDGANILFGQSIVLKKDKNSI
ncbi:MAG: hypothetical protein QM751_04620 [Paludibacteraceae bacterium]